MTEQDDRVKEIAARWETIKTSLDEEPMADPEVHVTVDDIAHLLARVEALTVERDAARAEVERLRALVPPRREPNDDPLFSGLDVAVGYFYGDTQGVNEEPVGVRLIHKPTRTWLTGSRGSSSAARAEARRAASTSRGRARR